ncbi:hypothetical protein SAMD00079811_48510 [Scytonema sp. HK-05]|nr:hypothetical protein SAMD00079811_48510 [Scytonema sp. HK-05]
MKNTIIFISVFQRLLRHVCASGTVKIWYSIRLFGTSVQKSQHPLSPYSLLPAQSSLNDKPFSIFKNEGRKLLRHLEKENY